MSKAYILVYEDKIGSRERVRDFLDKQSKIETWRFDLPNTFYLISDYSANELADVFLRLTEKDGRFIIAHLGADKQGWLPRDTWNFINQKSK